jgi:carboxymethylenebutenolidase
MLNSAKFLKSHELSTGKIGATGFCWGGGSVNQLAVSLGADMQAAVPFYGAAPKSGIENIQAPLLIHYAEDDPRINAMRPDFEAALKAAGKKFEMHTYPGTKHGFHNNSTPRYNKDAAQLAWDRTIAFFKANLA